MKNRSLAPVEAIDQRILSIRGLRVILDTDLAPIFGVPTFRLNEAIKRNRERFPEDFMFQLTQEEFASLTSQIAISKRGRGGRRSLPHAFTEHGVLMAANVLRSDRAVRMSVHVVRAFVRLREMLASHKELAQKLAELEQRISKHDTDIQAIVIAIRRLMAPPEPPKKRVGFRVEELKVKYRIAKRGA